MNLESVHAFETIHLAVCVPLVYHFHITPSQAMSSKIPPTISALPPTTMINIHKKPFTAPPFLWQREQDSNLRSTVSETAEISTTPSR